MDNENIHRNVKYEIQRFAKLCVVRIGFFLSQSHTSIVKKPIKLHHRNILLNNFLEGGDDICRKD